MSDTAVLLKLLHLRELEKEEAQRKQIEARDLFEDIATKLYRALKAKETAEDELRQSMQNKTPIVKIKAKSTYIETLKQKIVLLQSDVQKARKNLQIAEENLTEAHVEMKKIEKMIEHREQRRRENEKKLEMKQMDEISLQQYMLHVQNR